MEYKGADSEEAKVKLVEDGRAFFCSELVVKAFKCVGLVQSDQACSNFLPGDLSSTANKLPLIDGATLGKEQLILTETMYQKQQTSNQ